MFCRHCSYVLCSYKVAAPEALEYPCLRSMMTQSLKNCIPTSFKIQTSSNFGAILDHWGKCLLDINLIKFRRFRQFRRYTKPVSSIEKDDLMSLPPLFRGKKFFPLPNGYYNRKVFIKTRSTRNIPRPETRDTYHVALPWTMKYFSPMLRG